MDLRTTLRTIAVAAAVLVSPNVAHAEWFVFPFAAGNTGGATTRDSASIGVSAGWMGSWYGGEVEGTWSPTFFDDDSGFRSKHRAATYTGTALAGPNMGTWRPYGAIGFGVLRSQIEEVGGLASLTDNRGTVHAGGGVMWGIREGMAVRGDVRYIRALSDTEPEGNVFPEQLAKFDYWRIGGGISFTW